MDDYKNIFHTIITIVSLLLGRFSFIQYKNANSVLGPIFFYGFNIAVIWIIMNMFISILNDAFRTVRAKPDSKINDYEIIEFLLERLKDFIGYRRFRGEHAFAYQKVSDIKHIKYISERKSNLKKKSAKIFERKSNLKKKSAKIFDEDSVEKENFCMLDWKSTDDGKFPQNKHLLNANEFETRDKFIHCTKLLYFKKESNE